jgi:hypothetical protein
MPYTFSAPVEQHRVSNPADELVQMVTTRGDPQPLGATVSFCNGVRWSGYEPGAPAATIAPQPGGFRLSAVQQANFAFTNTIEIPPAPVGGGWTSTATNWGVLARVVAKFPKAHGFPVTLPANTEAGVLRLIPVPTERAMCDHILFHERQHVADNKWIVDKTFKIWVDWLDTLAGSATAYTATDSATLAWFLGGGLSSIYWGRYILELANEMALHFHRRTDEGAAPVYTVARLTRGAVSGTDLVVELSARRAITAMNWNSPPHRCFELLTPKGFAAGERTSIIGNGEMGVPDWTWPAIALTQEDINQKEAPSADEGFMASFF